jgi:tetratricopeptide (TPR) repeat protein
VCIDGGLDAWVVPAQSQLAEAYRLAGDVREARLVAEDLLMRDPCNETHQALLRRILLDVGEPDPDGTIGALTALVGAPGPPPGTGDVDLTGAMNALSAGHPVLPTGADDAEDRADEGNEDEGDEDEDEGQGALDAADGPGLEDVFDGIRAKAASTYGVDGRQQLALGRTYLAAGLLDQAVSAFARAAHDAGVRGPACIALGEVFEEQQDYAHAIEWLERGADAPQISDSDRLDAMRRLARVLEAAGESARALAVWLEIQTLHPEDREAQARVARLSATGTGR